MEKYIQIPQDQIEVGQIERARELYPNAHITDDGQMTFDGWSDEQYEDAPGWLWSEISIPDCVVKER